MKIQNFKTAVNPFSGNSLVNYHFNKLGMSQLIDNELGTRVKYVGYQYNEIFRNLTNVFLSGGDAIEDVNSHFREHLKSIPDNNVPSADTVLRSFKELSTDNTIYTSDSGLQYNFNINNKLNRLNIRSLKLTKRLKSGWYYDFDYDNQINANNKWDAKRTYKKNKGYLPGIATIGNNIVGIENRDGNANVKFKQADTLERFYTLLKSEGISVNRSRMDAGSYSKDIIDVVDKHSKSFYIRANKSADLFEQINNIIDWETVEINYKNYEVASIPFTQFYEDRSYRLVIMREKSSDNQLDIFTGGKYIYRSILTNDHELTEKGVIEYYNARGTSEKIFDEMNNDFGWKHLPFSFLNENNAFMIITAMIKNFYNYFIAMVAEKFDDINPTTRIKRFVFRFITVAGRWVYQGREWILKLYTKRPYYQII
ncbi:MAG: IS1380 family transposase [Bacteroidota bacterium]|nr:IS1380 family transposase [Bacteroidota bacterium]